MRGGQQGARQTARTEICTAKGEHEIDGDERIRLTNNKSKGSKAQTQGGRQGPGSGRARLTTWPRPPVFSIEMVTVARVFW